MYRLLLIAALMLSLMSCATNKDDSINHICLINGIASPCTTQQFNGLKRQQRNQYKIITGCKKKNLDWVGGDPCCPPGYKQIGCIANLPCQCKELR
ncbi:hypothetical protein [Piscirickettsia litoralis]|uniref:Lipoprotein n=1 Tax=Piscirickettsia litoralis TaxID=1891921 RepID=A0ABX3A3D5_9GAMM|nr:hypothetical protein [Piscirickettsia litoralis]ODN43020.1 hypothetical protein BGC07_08955 [Piscirickettsia litoralis]